jgi:ACS family hexuronate transporter-like MFS transporter
MTLLMVMGLPVAATPFVQSPAAALAIFFWMMFVASGFIVISLRSAAQAYPADQTALVAGIGAGSWSAVVAVLMPVLGRMVDQGAYGTLFFVVAALPVAGVLAWLALNREGAAESKAAG